MSLHFWLVYAAACLLMGVIPGPGVASIVGYAVSSGRRTALASVAGIALGNGIAISLSLAGVGALLAASATAFALIKWVGAAYLIAIGLFAIANSRESGAMAARERAVVTPRAAFFSNMAVGTFHPKTIVFFVAFVPQFIDSHQSYLLQAAILAATFCIVVATSDALYALAASSASAALRRPKAIRWGKRLGGAVLVGAGAATAMTRS
jgi:threonine/homoserine/homoserine lactone efflux protein